MLYLAILINAITFGAACYYFGIAVCIPLLIVYGVGIAQTRVIM